MRVVKLVNGHTSLHFLDLKISATLVQDQAVIAEIADTGGGYITGATTVSLADFVGSCYGAAPQNREAGGAGTLTYSATQGDTEGLVRVCINPDAIYEARMSAGAVLADLQTVTTSAANAAGTTITAADTPDNDMDDGTCWCVSGGNGGLSRRVTTYTPNTSWVVTVPFPRAIAANDTFHVCPYSPFVTTAIQLTTDLINANATIAYGTGANARVLELVLQGASNSFVRFVARDHALNELS